MHPLDGPRFKIRRAESTIRKLREMEETYRTSTKFRIVKSELNSKTGKHVYRLRTDAKPLSPQWGVLIGEVAHNLRSALEHLVYQLAVLNNVKDPKNTRFPVCRFSENFIGAGLKDIHPNHRKRIEREQPYKRGSKRLFPRGTKRKHGRASVLYLLHELNKEDKHRLIQAVAYGQRSATASAWGAEDLKFSRKRWALKDGAKICEAGQGTHVGRNFDLMVTFGETFPEWRGFGVQYTLRKMAKLVFEIVESFAPEFP